MPFRGKVLCPGNDHSLDKHRNALRVSLSAPTDCVVPLGKGTTIACEERLAVNAGKLTELAIITLMKH